VRAAPLAALLAHAAGEVRRDDAPPARPMLHDQSEQRFVLIWAPGPLQNAEGARAAPRRHIDRRVAAEGARVIPLGRAQHERRVNPDVAHFGSRFRVGGPKVLAVCGSYTKGAG